MGIAVRGTCRSPTIKALHARRHPGNVPVCGPVAVPAKSANIGSVLIDGGESPNVEVIAEKVSGKPLLCDTRIPADMLVAYYESLVTHGMEPDQAFADTKENYPGAGADRLRRVLDYARAHQRLDRSA